MDHQHFHRLVRKPARFGLACLLGLSIHVQADVLPGETKAYPCTACHGENGMKTAPGMPAIGGCSPELILAAMDDFRAARRFQPYMLLLLASMDKQDMEDVAEYFAIMGAGEGNTPLY